MPLIPHNTDLYALGRGVLYIKDFEAADSTYAEMGNAPTIEVEPTYEQLDHYSSQAGLRTKDKTVILQAEYTVNFELDEIAAINLNKYLMGTISVNVISGLQGTTQEYTLKFCTDNPVGQNSTWVFHRCNLRPNGAMSLIGAEWQMMAMTAMGLSDSTNNPSSPYFNVTYCTTTTTTTTTSSTTTTTTA
jgi:hypothetical protein